MSEFLLAATFRGLDDNCLSSSILASEDNDDSSVLNTTIKS